MGKTTEGEFHGGGTRLGKYWKNPRERIITGFSGLILLSRMLNFAK